MSGLDRMIVDGLKAGIREEREAKAKADREAEERTRIGNTPTEPLDPESDEAEALLDAAKEAQTTFWKALYDLEVALGIELEGANDLQGHTVKTLLEMNEAEDDHCDECQGNGYHKDGCLTGHAKPTT